MALRYHFCPISVPGAALTVTVPVPGKARAAAKVNPTIVNAVHAFYHGEGIDTDCPDYNITQHASTGRRYPSAHAFYSSMHGTNTRKGRGKDSNLTDCSSGGEVKLVTYT